MQKSKDSFKDCLENVNIIEYSPLGLWAVVNNAAIERILDVDLVPIDQMKRVAEVNLYGMVRVTKAFIPMIRKSKGTDSNVIFCST